MSGFFSQLLARAQGDAGPSRVRPQAVVRWAGHGEAGIEPDEGMHGVAAPLRDIAQAPALLEEPLPRAATPSVVVTRFPQLQQAGPAAHVPAIETQDMPPSAPERPKREPHASALPTREHSAARPAAAAAEGAAPLRAAPTLLPKAPSFKAATPPPRLQAETTASRDAEPATLSAAAPASRGSRAMRATGAHDNAQHHIARSTRAVDAASREDTTVVHVSIGRVDLFAPAPAPAPRTRAATAPRGGSVPLAEYLRGKPR